MAKIVEREPAPFEGFGPHALEFFEGLEADNSKGYWSAHKAQYDEEIAEPLRALAESLAPRFGEAKIFRPYRDVRFSPDKRPYQEHASLGIHGPQLGSEHGALYLQLSPEGLLLAGGLYAPARDQLERFRDLQDDPDETEILDALLERLAMAGYPLGSGAPVKTAPRGRPVDHPRIELIRRTMLTVAHTFAPAPWFFAAEALDRVVAGFETIGQWNAWLGRHVGPSEKPLRAY